MNERAERRLELDLTQSEAARRAGVSLATWRRWEEDPGSVSEKTRQACENALERVSERQRAQSDGAVEFTRAWQDSTRLTPRQACAISGELDMWHDAHLSSWIDDPSEPLHDVPPFDDFDLRVMMLVGENRAWVEAVRQRCRVVAVEIKAGVLPFDRPGPFIDEVLIGAALSGAQASLEEMPELYAEIPARDAVDDEENARYVLGDDDWNLVAHMFDDECRWLEWEVPIREGHPLLSQLLAERHPYRWLDAVDAVRAS